MRTVLLCLVVPVAFAQTWVLQPNSTLNSRTASLRGISIVDAKHAWASGTDGTVLRTTDGGTTWVKGSVPGSDKLDFRGVRGFGANGAILMASGEGMQSALYKTSDGTTWSLLSKNPDQNGFFDAIVLPESLSESLSDPRGGLLLGDPVQGSFTLFRFSLAASALSRIPLPPALPGEGAFAASNSSLVVRGKHVWFGTGGKSGARVFRSDDMGATWSVATTTLGGADGAGIFSLAFRDDKHGIAIGGDYSKPTESVHTIAITSDGGVTWSEPSDSKPGGYRSAVAYLAQHSLWIAAGPSGSDFSSDDGQHWTPFDDGAFNAIGIGPGGACFAVGPKGRIAKFAFLSSPTVHN